MKIVDRKIENLSKTPSSIKQLIMALLNIFKCEKKLYAVCLIISAFPTFFMSYSYDTIVLMEDSFELILNVILAVFGIVFTGYALLQAFLNKNIVRILTENSENTKDIDEKDTKNDYKFLIQTINDNFINVLFISLFNIVILFTLLIIIKCLPLDFSLTSEKILNDVMCFLLLTPLMGVFIFNIISTKSIFHDLYIMFNLTVLSILNEKNN